MVELGTTASETQEWLRTGDKLFVTGHTGLLGYSLLRSGLGIDRFVGASRGETTNFFSGDDRLEQVKVDLLKRHDLKEAVKRSESSVIVHLAAATDLKKCQENPEWARRLNVDATRNVAEVAEELGLPLFAVSTEMVFGRYGGPNSESTVPDLDSVLRDETGDVVNEYGRTKLQAEMVVREVMSDGRFVIARVSAPYDHRYLAKIGAPPAIYNRLKDGKPIAAVNNGKNTYGFAQDYAKAINRLVGVRIWEQQNVVHIGGPENISALDIVNTVLKYVPSTSEITEVDQDQYFRGQAPRAIDGGLKTETLDRMGIKIRSWDEVLQAEILASAA